MLRILLLLSPATFLFSCYCFHKVRGASSVRDLTVAKSYSNCHVWGGRGKTFQFNMYYGYPPMDLNRYRSQQIPAASETIRTKVTGQFGIRAEKYIPVYKGFHVLGLGLDYSQNRFGMEYTLSGSSYRETSSFTEHRVMLSANFMTWVSRHWIGYVTLQGGINRTHKTITSKDSGLVTQEVSLPGTFGYRAGYGLQYYLKGPWGFALEGGYGGGAYVRLGIFAWIF